MKLDAPGHDSLTQSQFSTIKYYNSESELGIVNGISATSKRQTAKQWHLREKKNKKKQTEHILHDCKSLSMHNSCYSYPNFSFDPSNFFALCMHIRTLAVQRTMYSWSRAYKSFWLLAFRSLFGPTFNAHIANLQTFYFLHVPSLCVSYSWLFIYSTSKISLKRDSFETSEIRARWLLKLLI